MVYTTCPGCFVHDYDARMMSLHQQQQSHQNSKTNTSALNTNDEVDQDVSTVLLCPSCINASLYDVKERHQLAKETWYESRMKCHEYFQQKKQQQTNLSGKNFDYYNHQYQSLRNKLQELQQQCHTMTMDTCTFNLKIIERQEQVALLNHNLLLVKEQQQQKYQSQSLEQRRQVLSQLQQSLCGYSSSNDSNNDDKNGNNNDSTNTVAQKDHEGNNFGAYINHIKCGQQMIRTLRFLWTVQAFTMFRLQIDQADLYNISSGCDHQSTTDKNNETKSDQQQLQRTNNNRKKKNTISGIGKICGLPLPHAGFELYGVLPPEELQSALRLVAQLTFMISRCLNITLPHPICLLPTSSMSSVSKIPSLLNEDNGDIANMACNHRTTTKDSTTTTNSITSSITTLLSGVDIRPTVGNECSPSMNNISSIHQQNHHQQLLLQMDTKHVEQRIRYATCAILAEDRNSTTTYYKLSTSKSTTTTNGRSTSSTNSNTNSTNSQHPLTHVGSTGNNNANSNNSSSNEEEFMIALQLLQNNIFVICRTIGVPIDTLYPGEAILLNLYTIQLFCSTFLNNE